MPRTKFRDLKGLRFGRLEVIAETDKRVGTHIVWRCQCLCGTLVFVLGNNLTSGNTLSCGCWRNEIAARPNKLRDKYAEEQFS